MLDAVLDQRLQQHSRHHDIQRVLCNLLHDLQLITETHHLDIQVVVGELQLLPQRQERLTVLQQHAQNIRQLHNHLPRQLRLRAHQRSDRVQRVEQKVWIDLSLQRIQPRLQQQPSLLLQLALHANRIPYLQWNPHHNRSRRADQQLHPPLPRVQREKATRIKHRQHTCPKLHSSHQQQQHNLPVQLRSPQVPRYPPVDTQVDHRRERPHVLRVREASKRSSNSRDHEIHRQRPILVMQQRRNSQSRSTCHRRQRPHQNPEQDRRLKREIRRQKVRHRRPHPDAQRQRRTDDRDQRHRLSRSPARHQQQVLEPLRTRQRTRYRRRHAQLHQQRNQNQLGIGLSHITTLRPPKPHHGSRGLTRITATHSHPSHSPVFIRL